MSKTSTGQPVAVGDTVWSWYDDTPVRYGGADPGRPAGGTTLRFGIASGELPVRSCDPTRVAPVTITIGDRDDRLSVQKRPRAEMPYGAPGPWRLTLPGITHPSWHRIKRDAVTAGLRRLAILDWHAQTPPATGPADRQDGPGANPAP